MSIALNGDGIISGVSSISNPSDITVGTGASVFSPAANTLAFGTNGSERVRVDSTGITKLYGDGSTQCKIYGHYGGGLNWIIGNEGNQNLSINAFDAYPIVFKTSGSEKARILSGGGLTFNGDTAAANALDDYEEGTWTPVISDGTNNATMSGFTGGRYTKIGNQVTCVSIVGTTSLGSVSGVIRITGLPFINGSQYSNVASGWAENLNITAGHSIGGWIGSSEQFLRLTVWSSSAGTASMTSTDWSSDGGVMLTFSYLTS